MWLYHKCSPSDLHRANLAPALCYWLSLPKHFNFTCLIGALSHGAMSTAARQTTTPTLALSWHSWFPIGLFAVSSNPPIVPVFPIFGPPWTCKSEGAAVTLLEHKINMLSLFQMARVFLMSRDYAGRKSRGTWSGWRGIEQPSGIFEWAQVQCVSCAVFKVLAGVLFISLLMALCS